MNRRPRPGLIDTMVASPRLSAAFILFSLIALAFAASLAVKAVRHSGTETEPIRPWMTVGYIARARGLDPRRIDAIADLPTPVDGRPLTLEDIAAMRGVPVDEVIGQVRDAVQSLRRDASQEKAVPPASKSP
ncbi:MAG: hypothetical protein MUC58_12380 [Rhizobiaceae bacterium]|jgi:hypothetical protein|nr:hypothetical protein [Rhizobiaceae bacterium]